MEVVGRVSVGVFSSASILSNVLCSVKKSVRTVFQTGWAPFAVVLLLILGVESPGLAQGQGSADQGVGQREATRSNIASYYYYAEPGDLTMQVNVWGTVRNPGRYEVRTETDLGELLSYAGGPQLTRMREQDERTITIRVARVTEGRRTIVFETELDSMITSSEAYPVLEGGDVVTVETTEDPGFTWQDAIGTIGSVASIGLLVVRAIEIGR